MEAFSKIQAYGIFKRQTDEKVLMDLHRRIKGPETPPPLNLQEFGSIFLKGVCGLVTQDSWSWVAYPFSILHKVSSGIKIPSVSHEAMFLPT